MKVKEAIEFIEDENIYRHSNDMDIPQQEWNKYDKLKQQVIALLKQGEKYKLMWGKIDEEYGHIDVVSFGVNEHLSQWMGDLKQKYFPKENKKEEDNES